MPMDSGAGAGFPNRVHPVGDEAFLTPKRINGTATPAPSPLFRTQPKSSCSASERHLSVVPELVSAAPTNAASTEPAPTEPTHRTKATRALRPERARPELTVEHGIGSRTGALPAATDPLLEACGR
jgi:hypothetical protein